MIQIADLKLTQESLRREEQIELMIEYVSQGGKFNLEAIAAHHQQRGTSHRPGLIAINKFEDGELYVRDGHHRVGAVWLAGREFLHDDEYVIENYTYQEYLEINLSLRYVTPFDPRIEVRFGDFFQFREDVMQVFREQGDQAALKYIEDNKYRYCSNRRLDNSIEALFRKFSGVI